MNLSIAPTGENLVIQKVKIKGDQGKQLANMGFVEGARVVVVSENSGSLIIKIKDSRVGIGNDIARKIIVRPE